MSRTFASIRRGLQHAVRHRTGKPAAGLKLHVPPSQTNTPEDLIITPSSGNVFRDLGFSKAEAENLRLKAQLMRLIDAYFRESGMTQATAAKELGLTQPRLNALLKGKIDDFSLDALVMAASNAGMSLKLVVKKAA